MIGKSAAYELRTWLEKSSTLIGHTAQVRDTLWQALGRKRRGLAALAHPGGAFHSRSSHQSNALVGGLCSQSVPPKVYPSRRLKVAVDVDEGEVAELFVFGSF